LRTIYTKCALTVLYNSFHHDAIVLTICCRFRKMHWEK